jgi:DNA repair exonuclease SbcCD ATPase subunit
MTDYIEPPQDLPLSQKVKGLRKAYEDAKGRLDKYRQENSRYAPRKTLNSLDQYIYHVPAIRDAEQELKDAELEAVANGKALPDRDSVLSPIVEKVSEYRRTVPALEALVSKAHQEYVEGVKAELVPMGLKEAAKAAKYRDEYEAAWKAMEAARAKLERAAGLFTWCVSAGDMDTHPRHGHSQGDNLEYWQLTEDGQLTFEASRELDYLDWVVKVPGLIEPNPNPPVTEEFNHNPKPRQFLASVDGYGSDWEH